MENGKWKIKKNANGKRRIKKLVLHFPFSIFHLKLFDV